MADARTQFNALAAQRAAEWGVPVDRLISVLVVHGDDDAALLGWARKLRNWPGHTKRTVLGRLSRSTSSSSETSA